MKRHSSQIVAAGMAWLAAAAFVGIATTSWIGVGGDTAIGSSVFIAACFALVSLAGIAVGAGLRRLGMPAAPALAVGAIAGVVAGLLFVAAVVLPSMGEPT